MTLVRPYMMTFIQQRTGGTVQNQATMDLTAAIPCREVCGALSRSCYVQMSP